MKRAVNANQSSPSADAIDTGVIIFSEDAGIVITPDEAKVFDKLDRKDGQPGDTKRARRTPVAKTNKERASNMPFDDPHHVEEEKFKTYLNAMMSDVKKNKVFAGKPTLSNKVRFGVENVDDLYRNVNILENPLQTYNVLQFLTPVLQKRLLQLDAYDQTEIKWRPVDILWQSKPSKTTLFPAGIGLDLSHVAQYIENNTGLDVVAMEMTIPSEAEVMPVWASEYLNKLHSIAFKAVGLISIELVVDAQAIFRHRLIYAYGTTAALQYDKKLALSTHEFEAILARIQVPKGETRLHLERQDIFYSTEQHPIFTIPVTYVGRYYYAPAPAEKIEQNSLTKKLADSKLLWDLRPVFDAHDQQEDDKT